MTTSPPPVETERPLWHTRPGRVMSIASGLLAVLLAVGQIIDLPPVFDVLRRIVWISWLVSAAWILGVAISRYRRAFLWPVRRKLLLSYLFLGVVPIVLIVAFVLATGVLLYVTVAAYVFRDGYDDSMQALHDIAETSAIEVRRTPTMAAAGLERRYENLRARHPGLSLALLPVQAGGAVSIAGAWNHMPAPVTVPSWIPLDRAFVGTILVPDGAVGVPRLVMRAMVPTVDRSQLAIADLPVDASFVAAQRERTGITMTPFAASGCGTDTESAVDTSGNPWSIFRETVAFLDCTNWADGRTGRVSIGLDAPVAALYARLAALSSSQVNTPLADWASVLLQLLWVLGVLFLIIQGSAVVIGALLARSITSAVHELFEGTERVRQGDFTHPIRIESRDQLGALAGSFNRMSASIEHLLHVQREKQRLDDELRIAREIQKSLLPVQPPRIPGLDIADLCEPAREVGGDYYDFFILGPRQLGVLIADVSGKGTSAALYMAELKGIMLALSDVERSPRSVLLHVNRLLAGHLDGRSFITMTYAIVDLDRRTLTVARGGHTPLVHVSAGRGHVVAPSGMVLGLSLPRAADLFAQVLEEQVIPFALGDVIVLYTDGVTDAMDPQGELFGEAGLTRVVVGQQELSAAGIRERVVREVRAFVGTAEAHDDMTMVVLKIVNDMETI